MDNEAVIPQVWVTFNNNRTSYQFNQRDVKLETTPKSMYGTFLQIEEHKYVVLDSTYDVHCILHRDLVGRTGTIRLYCTEEERIQRDRTPVHI